MLPVRGVLYTLTRNLYLLVAIQVLDGIGAGIFGVVSVLVIADLTRGTLVIWGGRDLYAVGSRVLSKLISPERASPNSGEPGFCSWRLWLLLLL